jgi:NADP-dependent 3-hydroxy acid dehydrogenase YdfG
MERKSRSISWPTTRVSVLPINPVKAGDFGKVFDRHVRGTLLMAQDMLPLMREGGRIVGISAPEVVAGAAGKGLSSSPKAAVEILTKCWAEELGRKKICVNRGSSKATENRGCNLEEVEVELARVVAWLVARWARRVGWCRGRMLRSEVDGVCFKFDLIGI